MTVPADAAKNPQHCLLLAACFSALTKGASSQGALNPGAGIVLQLLSALAICVVASASLAQTSAPVSMSMPTASRVQSPGWWPTKGDSRPRWRNSGFYGREAEMRQTRWPKNL